jgi:hypothetical protein
LTNDPLWADSGIQPDTLVPNPADSQAYNRYAYCRNNPVMLNDPSGRLYMGSGGSSFGMRLSEIGAGLVWIAAKKGKISGEDAVKIVGSLNGGSRMHSYRRAALTGERLGVVPQGYNLNYSHRLRSFMHLAGVPFDNKNLSNNSIALMEAIAASPEFKDYNNALNKANRRAAGIGALTIALSFVAGPLGTFLGETLGAFWGAVATGASMGALSGGATAAINGGDILQGVLKGAAIGGIVAAANFGLGKITGWQGDKATLDLKGNPNALSGGGQTIGVGGIGGKPLGGTAADLVNPSHGHVLDAIESVQEFLFGPGTWSRSAAPILDKLAATGYSYNFLAHSEGGLLLSNAFALMKNSFTGGSVTYWNSFVNIGHASRSAASAGVSAGFDIRVLDLVPAVANPPLLLFAAPYSPVYIGTGARVHGQ